MISIIYTFFLINLIAAVPLPAIITRYHTAEAVTQTILKTTGTTTVWIAPVGIFVNPDGSSSTSTVWDGQWNTYPVTFTSNVNKGAAAPAPTTPTTTQEPAPEPTTQAPALVQPTTTSIAPPPTTETTPPQPSTTAAPPPPPPQPETTQAAPQPQPTTSSQAPPPPPKSETTQNQPETSYVAPTTSTTSTTTTSSSTTTQGSQQTPSDAKGAGLNANLSPPNSIVYSPYANDHGCKSSDQINEDLEFIASKGIKNIRSYGTDCGSLTTVLTKAKQLGLTVNQGVWISEAGIDSADDQINQIISYGQQNGWDIFNLITFGNEAINSNFISINDMLKKFNSVKSKLQSAGYQGYVTTAEPPATFIKYPQLCTQTNMDIVAINPHSYFNENISPENSGNYVTSQQSQVASLCNGKSVWITETGYPSQGSTLGLNVPTLLNQKIAIESILKETGGDCTILTTYNDFWKDPGPYGIEQYFGVINLFN
ncbi:SCW11 [Candida pseudojiufengensis]|uniref:SCW11 n=1 Tax=Candida pseudojiufengensis TaxID=497109 RepID=UPI002224B71F|nr:SCW11 [Candida pseudojiufengensis]KAI5964236.1 SCW11 [Candida pseudojiufengensis]